MPTTRESNTTAPKVYILANNGESVCENHLDRYGVRRGTVPGHRHLADSRGGRPLLVTPEVAQECHRDYNFVPACEICGARASMVVA